METDAFAGFVPFQQSEAYAAAAAAQGARVAWVELGRARTLVVERGRLRLMLRGMPAPGTAGEARRALRQLARWPGVTIATPEVAMSGFGLIPVVTPAHHALWDLSGDLRAGMAGRWRNRLVAAERRVHPRPAGRATLDALIAAEAAQRAERRYRGMPEGFTRALPTESLRLWDWRSGGAVGAAMAFVVHGQSATYHLGWASAQAWAAGVHPAMLTRAAEALRAEGVRWLDLGLVDTEAAPGLARFKLGTGARLKRLGPTLLVLP